ncbi:MAG: hypothetical protein C9356_09990 [Oleiphilus sp.]|nr:MAG: hypothetical protein C9356_09990 [Oleiphilus sp.]
MKPNIKTLMHLLLFSGSKESRDEKASTGSILAHCFPQPHQMPDFLVKNMKGFCVPVHAEIMASYCV